MKTTRTATGLVVCEGKCSVEITPRKAYGEDRQEWECSARVANDWHGFFSGKTHKSEKAAVRAAEKWVTQKVAQLAAEAAEPKPAQPTETPAWLADVYAQWERGDVAVVK